MQTRIEELEEERTIWFGIANIEDTSKNKIDYYESLRSNIELSSAPCLARELTLFAISHELLILKMQRAMK